jgi:hypothetical protein
MGDCVDEGHMEHILHHTPMDFYLIENLHEHVHSLDNKGTLSDPQIMLAS